MEKVKAICVKSIDYKDNDSLITLATLERGKITAVVKGSKKQSSKLRFSASLFCFGEYILNISKTGKYTVTGCDLIDGFFKLREDIEKFYISSIVLEILDKNLVVPNDKLILLALKALKSICYDEKDSVSSLIEFCYDALVVTGYSFPKVECKVCGTKSGLYFDKTDLDFVCKAHKMNKGVLLKEKEISAFNYIYNQQFEKLEDLDHSVKQNVLYILIKYFEITCDLTFKTYQSYFDLLKEIY